MTDPVVSFGVSFGVSGVVRSADELSEIPRKRPGQGASAGPTPVVSEPRLRKGVNPLPLRPRSVGHPGAVRPCRRGATDGTMAGMTAPSDEPTEPVRDDGARLLTLPEVAGMLRVNKTTLYTHFIHTRRLTPIQIGRRRLVPLSAVRDLIESLGAEGAR